MEANTLETEKELQESVAYLQSMDTRSLAARALPEAVAFAARTAKIVGIAPAEFLAMCATAHEAAETSGVAYDVIRERVLG
jgi:hypothetical protein